MTAPRATGRGADRWTTLLLAARTIRPSNFGNGFMRGNRNCRISPPRFVRLRFKLKKFVMLSLIAISQSQLFGGFCKILRCVPLDFCETARRPDLKFRQHPHKGCVLLDPRMLEQLLGQAHTPLFVARSGMGTGG